MSELRLRPSSSSAWMKCPAFVYYDQTMPDTTSEAAERGTWLHEVGSSALLGKEEIVILTGEDLDIVSDYVSYVQTICAKGYDHFHVEETMQFSELLGGTPDCVIVGNGSIHVIDLKTGSYGVSAKGNTQLMLYLIMVLQKHNLEMDEYDMFLHIVQPTVGNNVHKVDPNEIIALLVKLSDSIARITEQSQNQEWSFDPSTDTCRWCKGAALCDARRDYVTAAFIDKPRSKYTPDEMAAALQKAADLKTWIADIEKYALAEAMKGRIPPGYQIGESRTMRRWESERKAEIRLNELGLAPEDIWDQKIISPAQAEKRVDKEEIEDIIVKPQGKPTLIASDF